MRDDYEVIGHAPKLMALWLTEIFETANKQRESYGKGQASLQRWRLWSENPLQVYV